MTEMSYRCKDNYVCITRSDGGEIKIELPFRVEKVVCSPGILAVLVEPPTDVVFNENVFAYDFHGTLQWQIPKRRYLCEACPYTGLWCEGDRLATCGWDGMELRLEPATGQILSKEFMK